MGFINPGKRTATVVTEEKTFLMRFDRSFIKSLDVDDQLKIYTNFALEISSKLIDSNALMVKACNKLSGGNG